MLYLPVRIVPEFRSYQDDSLVPIRLRYSYSFDLIKDHLCQALSISSR